LKFNKAITAYSSLFVILLLLMPVLAIDYVKDNQIDLIKNGESLEFKDVDMLSINNSTIYEHFTGIDIPLNYVTSTNIDYLAGSSNFEVANNVIYLGNNSYKIDTTQYTILGSSSDFLYIPIDLTPHDLATMKALKLTYDTTTNDPSIYMFSGSTWQTIAMTGYDSATNEKIFIVDVSVISTYLSYPDENIYLRFNYAGDYQDNITFSLSYADEFNATSFTIDDTTQYLIIVSIAIITNIFALILMSDTVDILIDKKKNQWKR